MKPLWSGFWSTRRVLGLLIIVSGYMVLIGKALAVSM